MLSHFMPSFLVASEGHIWLFYQGHKQTIFIYLWQKKKNYNSKGIVFLPLKALNKEKKNLCNLIIFRNTFCSFAICFLQFL